MNNNELNTSAEPYDQVLSDSTKTLGSAAVGLENSSDESWMPKARCQDLDPEIFFPTDGSGVPLAKHYCAECPVKKLCLDYALENHIEHGIWGGASERERRSIQRHRKSFGLPSKK